MKNFEELVPETFKMDHILPYFIHIYPKEKSEFLKKIPLFQRYLLILQVHTSFILLLKNNNSKYNLLFRYKYFLNNILLRGFESVIF